MVPWNTASVTRPSRSAPGTITQGGGKRAFLTRSQRPLQNEDGKCARAREPVRPPRSSVGRTGRLGARAHALAGHHESTRLGASLFASRHPVVLPSPTSLFVPSLDRLVLSSVGFRLTNESYRAAVFICGACCSCAFRGQRRRCFRLYWPWSGKTFNGSQLSVISQVMTVQSVAGQLPV